MKDVTVIIPIHKIDENSMVLLEKAITSVIKTNEKNIPKVLLIIPENLKLPITIPDFIEIVCNTGKTDFASQINFGVSKVETKYFSILEYDDELSTTYFKNFETFKKHYDASVYLPIIVEVKENQGLVRLTNEYPWSKSFIENDEFGFITNKQLQEFSYFYLSGAIFDKNDFVSIGMLKNKFDVACVYEFLLRLTFNNKKVFVIPKIGYLHTIDREDSATKEFAKIHDKASVAEQFKQAKTEYMLN